jgi:hypothetical protein
MLVLLGYVVTMNQTRAGKIIFKNKEEGGRKIGRPRLRSLEDEENNL